MEEQSECVLVQPKLQGSEHGVRPIPCQTVIKPSFLLNTCTFFLRIHFRDQPLNVLSCNGKVLKVNFVVYISMRVLSAAYWPHAMW